MSCTRTASSVDRSCLASSSSRTASRLPTSTETVRPSFCLPHPRETSCLTSHLSILPLPDYRRVPGAVKKVYFSSSDPADEAEFRKMFDSLTSDSPVVSNRKIDVWGRKLAVAESNDKVAWFTFQDLCGKNLGAADYLEVTKTWGTIFIDGIP